MNRSNRLRQSAKKFVDKLENEKANMKHKYIVRWDDNTGYHELNVDEVDQYMSISKYDDSITALQILEGNKVIRYWLRNP